MQIIYENIDSEPDLCTLDIDNNIISGVHYDILNSDMENKSIDWCRWDNENGHILTITFIEDINISDRTKLDNIIQKYQI